MAKKGIIGAIFLVIIGFTLIIGFPIPLLSIKLSTYKTINKSISYPYSDHIETLNLNIDVGDIEVRYIPLTIDNVVVIDVNVVMSGSSLAERTYEDFIEISSVNTDSTLNFTLAIISDDWFDSLLWLEQDVSIVVNIRKDVVLDINTELETGNFEIFVPWGVSLGKLLTNISKGNVICNFSYCLIKGNLTARINQGDIFYNLDHCTIGGNITGITNEGDLKFKSNNIEFTKNSNWTLKSNNTYVEIYQSKEIGANITGTAIIYTGNVDLFYQDNTSNIGAMFHFPLSDWVIPLHQPGFEDEILYHGFLYKSYDFPAENNFIFTFYHLGGVALNHFIEIESVPN